MVRQAGILIVILVIVSAITAGCSSQQQSTITVTPVLSPATAMTTQLPTAEPTGLVSLTAPQPGTSPSPSQQSGNTPIAVSIKNLAFDPATLTITPGTTVVWTNYDTVPHDVTSFADAPVAIKSPSLSQGGTFQFTFTQPGTYSYYCSIHPFMKAEIVVRS